MRPRTSNRLLARAAVGVLSSALAFGCWARSSASEAPEGTSRLSVEAPSHDFGEAWDGSVLTHPFALRVEGSEDLVIHKIKASCGCTVAETWRVAPDGERTPYVEGEAIAPGSRIELAATFVTTRRLGVQTKPISVYHSGVGGKLELVLEAVVQPFFEASPTRLELGRFSTAESRKGSSELRVQSGEAVALSVDPETVPPALGVVLVPLDPDAEGRSSVWRLEAELAAGAPAGDFRAGLRLETDRPHIGADQFDDGRPQFLGYDLQVSAQVLGRISAKPQYFSFGQVRPGRLVARSLRVNVYDPSIAELPTPTWTLLEGKRDEPFSQASACHVTVRAVEGVRGWDVELALDGLATDTGAFHGRLILSFPESDLPDYPISFSGFHRATAPPKGSLPEEAEPQEGS